MLTDTVVPLSAYIVQQRLVNNPNDTDHTSHSILSPFAIHRNPGEFIAHTFTPGESFHTNATLFGPYTIRSAYALNTSAKSEHPVAGKGVSSFAFNNNDLSTCDIWRITLDMFFSDKPSILPQATVR